MSEHDRAVLLFIPGLMSDEAAWRDVMTEMRRQGWRCEIADIQKAPTIGQMALDCLARVKGPLVPIGHSLGGRVAFDMVRQAPERVSALVVADTGIHPLAEGELARREEMIRIANDAGMDVLADVWLPPMVASACHQNPVFMGQMREMMHRAGPDVHERQIRALINRPDAARELPKITCPALVIVGSEDGFSPVSHHQEMVRLIPDAELSIIEGAGHFAQTEMPDAFSRLLSDWLKVRGVV